MSTNSTHLLIERHISLTVFLPTRTIATSLNVIGRSSIVTHNYRDAAIGTPSGVPLADQPLHQRKHPLRVATLRHIPDLVKLEVFQDVAVAAHGSRGDVPPHLLVPIPTALQLRRLLLAAPHEPLLLRALPLGAPVNFPDGVDDEGHPRLRGRLRHPVRRVDALGRPDGVPALLPRRLQRALPVDMRLREGVERRRVVLDQVAHDLPRVGAEVPDVVSAEDFGAAELEYVCDRSPDRGRSQVSHVQLLADVGPEVVHHHPFARHARDVESPALV
ncbi:glycine cleavage system aminomethyltransferase GcvT [Babesia caballi]|uniref:Glycine cleavage system aminomethyltransferase GcvT n=1 Tax=Babesia caballi TaxID=5871 RepID=A0AAV4M2X0_BABCB|nr:glycine cleavage system aminomethyltransferase GcvT [Babesia caballi]